MRIAVLTIATGKYDVFIEGLVQSCEKYFLPGTEKKYFVFTDSEKIETKDNIIRVEQKKLGWPFDTMLRFHMFKAIKEHLNDFDYLFFMNANLKMVSTVGTFILETPRDCGLILTIHPGFYSKPKSHYPLERNTMSSFYFPPGKERNYFQGCFNGGKTKEFLEMSEILSNLIDEDLRKNIIPLWHDESALNWYVMEKTPRALDPTFAYPEPKGEDLDNHKDLINIFGDPKILQLDKDNYGGKKELRGQKEEEKND